MGGRPTPAWARPTPGAGARCRRIHNKTLVVYDQNNNPTWSTNTQTSQDGIVLWVHVQASSPRLSLYNAYISQTYDTLFS